MLLSLLLWAEDAPAAPPPQQPSLFNPIIIVPVLIMLFFLMVLGPNKRRAEEERQKMIKSLEKNDQILTNAGIYATIVSVSEDKDEMIVRFEDNVKVKMIRNCIARNLTKEEKAREAAQQLKASKEPAK
jgi:preprotein translocase subunit YajC